MKYKLYKRNTVNTLRTLFSSILLLFKACRNKFSEGGRKTTGY